MDCQRKDWIIYLNLVILLHHGLRNNMRFSRAEALLFWGVQNLVDAKYNFEVFCLWFAMKIFDGSPATVPLYWEKSPTGKGSLDYHLRYHI